MLTVFFCGPLCFYLVYLVLANKPYRHVVQVRRREPFLRRLRAHAAAGRSRCACASCMAGG
jgi:hypothetical protein